MEGIYKLFKEWLIDEGFSGITKTGDRSENYLENLYLECRRMRKEHTDDQSD